MVFGLLRKRFVVNTMYCGAVRVHAARDLKSLGLAWKVRFEDCGEVSMMVFGMEVRDAIERFISFVAPLCFGISNAMYLPICRCLSLPCMVRAGACIALNSKRLSIICRERDVYSPKILLASVRPLKIWLCFATMYREPVVIPKLELDTAELMRLRREEASASELRGVLLNVLRLWHSAELVIDGILGIKLEGYREPSSTVLRAPETAIWIETSARCAEFLEKLVSAAETCL